MFDFQPLLVSDELSPSEASIPAETSLDERPLFDAYSQAVVDVVDRVGPAVVRVETPPDREKRQRGGTGSGVVISPDGLVLTNSHVVQGASAVRLALADTRTVKARVLGDDPHTDLALLRVVDDVSLPAARLGNSKSLRRGQLVVAIGNPLGFEFDGDGGRRVRARPLAALLQRPADRRRHPDRRRAQSRQFRRPAGLLARRGHRHQHRRDRRRPGHLLRRRQQHGEPCRERDRAPWPRTARLHRRRRPDRALGAPARRGARA